MVYNYSKEYLNTYIRWLSESITVVDQVDIDYMNYELYRMTAIPYDMYIDRIIKSNGKHTCLVERKPDICGSN